MHVDLNIDIEKASAADPIQISSKMSLFLKILVGVAVLYFIVALAFADNATAKFHIWSAYYVNFVFWMGLSVGGVITSCILQIVRAKWSPPVRRLAEANCAFFPWIFLLFLISYFGKNILFPWGTEPMPGREWWMQPSFVYGRFFVLLGALFLVLTKYVKLSLRSDIGVLRENKDLKGNWQALIYSRLTANWKGSETEVTGIQVLLSRMAPVAIILYAIVFTLFAFDMLMSMDKIWYANMFGGFYFVGSLYIAWASLTLLVLYSAKISKGYQEVVTNRQLWDLGMLTFGFCMLWGYLFFSQFLPQWYGNLPEETQWMILRVREFPWKGFAYFTFALCFVIPFITLLSRDLKRTPGAFSAVAIMILVGVWCEKYIIIVPHGSPTVIPFGLFDIVLFLGFGALYVLSVFGFLRKYPFLPVSHPLTRGSRSW